MRLPVTPQISTKDGTTNKNARLFNMLKEMSKTGEKAVIRPGLEVSNTYPGLGSGLIVFNGRLLVIAGDTIYGDSEWPLDSLDWSASTNYSFGDAVWYNGQLWFSQYNGNLGNTPGTGYWWYYSFIVPIYDPAETYEIGDVVSYGDVTYYSMAPSNTGNTPSTSPQWSTTAPGTSRYRVTLNSIAALNATTPGPVCASADAAGSAWFGTATTFKSCATKASGTYNWVTYSGVETRSVFGVPTIFVRVNQWSDPSPFDCSGTAIDSGVIDGGKITQTV